MEATLPTTARAPSKPLDRRLLLAAVAGAALLLAYLLPMFPQRIAAATTHFTDGSQVSAAFPTLVTGQHFVQARPPRNHALEQIDLDIEGLPGLGGSAWGWLVRSARGGATTDTVSLFICLAIPAVGALLLLALAGLAIAGRGDPTALVPAAIIATTLGLPALLLAWLHQVDFSLYLASAAGGALVPGTGWWVALAVGMVGSGTALSLRRETRRQVLNWWGLVFVVALTVWLLTRVRPQPFLDIWNFVGDGILVTLRIVVTSFGLIIAVSLLGGLGRLSRNPVIYFISSLYVEIVRGIPLLVQLLFIWYALPQVFDATGRALVALSPSFQGASDWLLGLRLDPFAAAVLGLTICYGAYGSEIFRAGIASIHHGQIEAARSLGMSYVQAMRYVILPQAVRVILPPIGNEFVALLKDSSLVSILAVSDLTRRGREYMSRTFLSFDTWILVALCYLVLTLFSSRAVELIESKSRFDKR